MWDAAVVPRSWRSAGLQGHGGGLCGVGAAGGGGKEPVAAFPEPAAAAEDMGLEAKNHEVYNNHRTKHYQGPHCQQRRNRLQGDANSQKNGCAVRGCL